MDAMEELPAEVDRALRGVERAIDRVVALLKGPDEEVRRGAMGALVAIGAPAVGALARALSRGRDRTFRVRVVEALGLLAPAARAEVLMVLAGVVADRDPAVRMAALQAACGPGPIPAPPSGPSRAGTEGRPADSGVPGPAPRRSGRQPRDL